MVIKVNDEYYEGSGNGTYGVFAKVKIIDIYERKEGTHFGIEIVDNYYSMWEAGIPKSGARSKAFPKHLFKSYEEAKKSYMSDMKFKEDHDIIKHVFIIY